MKKTMKKAVGVILSVLMVMSVIACAFSAGAEGSWVELKTSADESGEGELYLDLSRASSLQNRIYWALMDLSLMDDWDPGNAYSWVTPWGWYRCFNTTTSQANDYYDASDNLMNDCIQASLEIVDILKGSTWYYNTETFETRVELSQNTIVFVPSSISALFEFAARDDLNEDEAAIAERIHYFCGNSYEEYVAKWAEQDWYADLNDVIDLEALLCEVEPGTMYDRPIASGMFSQVTINLPDSAWLPVARGFSEDLDPGDWYLDETALAALAEQKWADMRDDYIASMRQYYGFMVESGYMTQEEIDHMIDQEIAYRDENCVNLFSEDLSGVEIYINPGSDVFLLKLVRSIDDPMGNGTIESITYKPFEDLLYSAGAAGSGTILLADDYMQFIKQIPAEEPDDPTPDDPTPDEPAPTDPDTDAPVVAGDVCQWCGQVHSGDLFSRLLGLIHGIFYFIRSLLGLFGVSV